MENNKKVIAFIRSFNDLDQLLPIIDFILKNRNGEVSLYKLNESIINGDYHLKYLNDKYSIEPKYFYDIIFSNLYKKLFFFNQTTMLFINKYKFPFSMIFKTIIKRFFSFLLQFPIKNFVYSINNQTVLLIDSGSEESFPINKVVFFAKKMNIPVSAYAHGYSIHTNLESIKGKKLSDNNKLKYKLINFLRFKRIYADKYLTCRGQRDTYFKSTASKNFKKFEKIFEIGTPRFTVEWNNILFEYINRKIKFEYGDAKKLNLVLFCSSLKFNVNENLFVDTIKLLSNHKNINFVYKAHTRGNISEFLNPSMGYNAIDIPSIVLSKWADVGIIYGSSIGFQLLIDKVPIIVPRYFHTNETLYEDYGVCIAVNNLDEFEETLLLPKLDLKNKISNSKIDTFTKEILYGNFSYEELLHNYSNEIIN